MTWAVFYPWCLPVTCPCLTLCACSSWRTFFFLLLFLAGDIFALVHVQLGRAAEDLVSVERSHPFLHPSCYHGKPCDSCQRPWTLYVNKLSINHSYRKSQSSATYYTPVFWVFIRLVVLSALCFRWILVFIPYHYFSILSSPIKHFVPMFGDALYK